MLGGKPVERSFIRIVCLLMGVGLQGPLQAQPRSTPEELRCLDSGRQAAQIRKDIEDARRLGVQGHAHLLPGSPRIRRRQYEGPEGNLWGSTLYPL